MVVDYLQKVHVRRTPTRHERITAVTEGLKDLALDHDVPILAVVASDKEGLASGKRMRVSNMRGSSALAYEADTVLLLNNKYDVVARHHLVYSTGNVEKFRNWAVLTVEKNRNGRAGAGLRVPQALRPVPLRDDRPAGRRAAGRRARLRRVAGRPRDDDGPGSSVGCPARRASTWMRRIRPRPRRRRCGTRLGSTWTPGPIVVETVTFLR